MPRPSQALDQALLRSGLTLYPAHGCSGLTVRRVAEHAGVRPAMLHYHYGNKDAFLRTVLQHTYDTLYDGLLAHEQVPERPATERLSDVLTTLAHFVRDHLPVIARVLGDVAAGETVAVEFASRNAPRHVLLIASLVSEAQRDGQLPAMPPIQGVSFLLGAVVAPLIVGGLATRLPLPPPIADAIGAGALHGDDAIARRVAMALAGLAGAADTPAPVQAAPPPATPSPRPDGRPPRPRRGNRHA